MRREEAIELIGQALKEVRPEQSSATVDENWRLLGGQSLLDSTGLVSLIVEVEQQINDRYDLAITIADDRAMSEKQSPFRTVGSLADYIVKLCGPAAGN
jgi:acyl carrier protein